MLFMVTAGIIVVFLSSVNGHSGRFSVPKTAAGAIGYPVRRTSAQSMIVVTD